MKRLTFKAEHEQPVLDGTKCYTSRWTDQKLGLGMIVAAVAPKGKKPAFLTPAAEGFCQLRIDSVEVKFWKDFTDEDAAKCGVTRDWYLRENPTASDMSRIWLYGFEVVK